MDTPAAVPSPQVRHLCVAPAPPVVAAVPLQPAVVARPVVVPLQSRPAEVARRTTLAEAQQALQRLGRTS